MADLHELVALHRDMSRGGVENICFRTATLDAKDEKVGYMYFNEDGTFSVQFTFPSSKPSNVVYITGNPLSTHVALVINAGTLDYAQDLLAINNSSDELEIGKRHLVLNRTANGMFIPQCTSAQAKKDQMATLQGYRATKDFEYTMRERAVEYVFAIQKPLGCISLLLRWEKDKRCFIVTMETRTKLKVQGEYYLMQSINENPPVKVELTPTTSRYSLGKLREIENALIREFSHIKELFLYEENKLLESFIMNITKEVGSSTLACLR